MKALQMPPEIHMGYRDLSDEAFVQAFESCNIAGDSFRHADHVRLAWIYVTKLGLGMAERRFCEGLRRLATHLGVPEKFHFTLTVAWLRAVAARVRADSARSFEDWIASHPRLLDRSFLHNYYSEARLASTQARTNWVEPDRRTLAETDLTEEIEHVPLELRIAARQ
jgi:hypothetical protein